MLEVVRSAWTDAGYNVTEIVRDPINGVVRTAIVYPAAGVDANGLQFSFGLTTLGVVASG